MDGSTAGATAPSQPTFMQATLNELQSLISMASAHCEGLAAQRNRLLGDLPPQPANPSSLDKGVIGGGSVSISDLAGAVNKLGGILRECREHQQALRQVG